MYIHGDLQRVFDALYHMGLIDPTLQKDWQDDKDSTDLSIQFYSAIKTVNTCEGSYKDLADELRLYDEGTLCLLAIQVAKEYVDFYSRELVH